MTEVYRVQAQKHRYEVHFRIHGRWAVANITYRTAFFARGQAKMFAGLGHEAKVIDTRGEGK